MAKRFPKATKFVPLHPEKYIGDVNNIVCRSGLEKRYFKYFDENPAIINYSSEELIIKYFYPIDRKIHRYYPDFVITVKDKNNKLTTIVVEVKPSCETRRPVKGKKTDRTFLNEILTWEKNQAKWQAATIFCEKHGLKFQILTEKEIKYQWVKK